MQNNSDPLPSISEAAASGAVARTFAELREVLRVPQVNLLWRCLAVDPDALAWSWQLLRPLYEAGHIWGEAARLVPELPVAATRVPSLDAADAGRIAQLLLAYERANSTNLLGMLVIARLARNEPAVRVRATVTADPPPPLYFEPPALADPAALPQSNQDLLEACNRLGADEPRPLLGSVYRQLVHWPSFLETVRDALEPLDRDGTLRTARLEVQVKSRAAAAALAAVARPPAGACPSLAEAVAERFGGDQLPRMLVLVTAMRRLIVPARAVQPDARG